MAHCEDVGRCSCMGWSSVIEIANCSRSVAHSLVWHRDSACLDYNGGEMRGGRGRLWEEMKGDVWGKRGSDLHDGEDGKRTKKGQRRGCPSQSEKCLCHVSQFQKAMTPDEPPVTLCTAIDHRSRSRPSGVLAVATRFN